MKKLNIGLFAYPISEHLPIGVIELHFGIVSVQYGDVLSRFGGKVCRERGVIYFSCFYHTAGRVFHQRILIPQRQALALAFQKRLCKASRKFWVSLCALELDVAGSKLDAIRKHLQSLCKESPKFRKLDHDTTMGKIEYT